MKTDPIKLPSAEEAKVRMAEFNALRDEIARNGRIQKLVPAVYCALIQSSPSNETYVKLVISAFEGAEQLVDAMLSRDQEIKDKRDRLRKRAGIEV